MQKILVVDDEEHITNLISKQLNEAGYDVVTSRSDLKLLEEIEDEKPDLVILEMVDYDGLDHLQDIRNHFCDLPVILATELVATIAGEGGISKSQTEKAVDGFVSAVYGFLPNGDKITLLGFGTFSSVARE